MLRPTGPLGRTEVYAGAARRGTPEDLIPVRLDWAGRGDWVAAAVTSRRPFEQSEVKEARSLME